MIAAFGWLMAAFWAWRCHRVERERARLERALIEMSAENKRLDLKIERMLRDHEKRGEVNARLNKELQQLKGRHAGTV